MSDPTDEGSAAPDAFPNIPAAAVARLTLYLRELRRLDRQGETGVSSSNLGKRLGVSAAVVRRDLAWLGQLGRRGVGYDVAALIARIRAVLSADQVWNVALIGAGSLGTALMRYRGFAEQGFRLRAAFDVRPDRLGLSVGEIPVLPMTSLEAELAAQQITLAILAVPAEAAQLTAERLAQAGIAGILNFAPVTLRVGGETCVANVDLANELQQLSFAVARQPRGDTTRER
jgi:redox-sensing transcriptional repressor